MPKELTDNGATFPATVTCPVESDPFTLVHLENGLQDLANRTANLALQPLAAVLDDITALKAVNTTSVPDNTVRIVDQVGVYIFASASAAAEALPWIVQPTTGSGRWLHVLNITRGAALGLATLGSDTLVPDAQLKRAVANGLATLDASVFVPDAQLTHKIVSVSANKFENSTYGNADFTTSSGSFVDVTGLATSHASAVANDELWVDATALCETTVVTSPPCVLEARIVITENGGAAIVKNMARFRFSGASSGDRAPVPAPFVFRHTITTGGTAIAKFQLSVVSGGGDVSVLSPSSIRSLLWRPRP